MPTVLRIVVAIVFSFSVAKPMSRRTFTSSLLKTQPSFGCAR